MGSLLLCSYEIRLKIETIYVILYVIIYVIIYVILYVIIYVIIVYINVNGNRYYS